MTYLWIWITLKVKEYCYLFLENAILSLNVQACTQLKKSTYLICTLACPCVTTILLFLTLSGILLSYYMYKVLTNDNLPC